MDDKYTESLLKEIESLKKRVKELEMFEAGHEKTERVLKKSEEKYRQLVELTRTGFLILDNRGAVIDANGEYVRLAGYKTFDEIAGRSVLEWTAKSEIEKNRKAVEECVRNGHIYGLEINYVDREGRIIPIEINAFTEGMGDNLRIISLCRDISERREAEESIKTEQEFTKKILDAQTDTFFVFDPFSGKALKWNKAFEQTSGYSGDEISRMKAPDAYHSKEDLEKALQAIPQIIEKGHGRIELELVRKDGRKIPFEYVASVISDSFGKPRLFISIGRDISERRKVVAKLKRSAEEWDKTFSSISDFIFILDAESKITRANKSFLDAIKMKAEDVLGRHCYEILHKSDKPWPNCPHQKTMTDCMAHTEEVDDPNIGFPLLVTTSPILDDNGVLIGSVHIAKDISVLKKTENELKEKMRELERFQKVTMGRERRIIELKDEIKRMRDVGHKT